MYHALRTLKCRKEGFDVYYCQRRSLPTQELEKPEIEMVLQFFICFEGSQMLSHGLQTLYSYFKVFVYEA